MADTTELRALYDALNEDEWRKTNKFSDDVSTVNEVLFNTYATAGQCERQLLSWFQRFQSCLFGRIAAAKEFIHFCIIRDRDIMRKTDQEIAGMISSALVEWKKRSVRPSEDFSTPAHGFVLAVCSPHVANAAPDAALNAFAEKIRSLWACKSTATRSGTVHWETLYLQNPEDQKYVKFKIHDRLFCITRGRAMVARSSRSGRSLVYRKFCWSHETIPRMVRWIEGSTGMDRAKRDAHNRRSGADTVRTRDLVKATRCQEPACCQLVALSVHGRSNSTGIGRQGLDALRRSPSYRSFDT